MDMQRSCGMMIKQLHTTLEKNANNTLKQCDLTVAQVSVLMALHQASDRQLPLKQLEKNLHLARSTTAGLAMRLEQKGLVEYREDTQDHRVKILSITQKGEDCCKTATEKMNETEEQLLSGLTDTEREIFLTLLNKVVHSLDEQ